MGISHDTTTPAALDIDIDMCISRHQIKINAPGSQKRESCMTTTTAALVASKNKD
jgi:hypothetical protein